MSPALDYSAQDTLGSRDHAVPITFVLDTSMHTKGWLEGFSHVAFAM